MFAIPKADYLNQLLPGEGGQLYRVFPLSKGSLSLALFLFLAYETKMYFAKLCLSMQNLPPSEP